jgi:tetratricopeptide (TPR) repeat protein
VERAEEAARKAIELAPDYAGGYGALAAIRSDHLKHVEAEDLFKQALARDPDDPEILSSYAAALFDLGYLKQALATRERVHLLEPLVPLYNRQRAVVIAANGNLDAGVTEAERLCSGCLLFLAPAYAQQGRFAKAADMLLQGTPEAAGRFAQPLIDGPFAEPLIEAAAQVMRAAAIGAEPPAQLPDFYSELGFVYAYTSTPERMLDWPEQALKNGASNQLRWIWWPTPSSVRKTERFKTLMRNAGIVDYWRARGWPDLCRPIGADDFICD